jgi:hypothetical protein
MDRTAHAKWMIFENDTVCKSILALTYSEAKTSAAAAIVSSMAA